MSTHPTFLIRELSPERDFEAWLRLIHTVEMEDSGAVETSPEHLRRALERKGPRRWVAESPADPEVLVGYALLFPQIPERSYVNVLIHPGWRRQGLGSRMLSLLNSAARESGARWAYNELNDRDAVAIAFARHNGFRPAGDAWVLGAPAEADFAEPAWPEGYSVRSYAEVNDIQTLADACNRGFGDMWGHHENTAGGVRPEELGEWSKNRDPSGIFLAFAPDGSVIGTCRAEARASEDLVDEPGVAPGHRQHRLQRPMVLTALRWLRSQARHPVRLESWGDTPETIALYEEIGFKLTEHAISMTYDLLPE
jgi:mycothiol synthase